MAPFLFLLVHAAQPAPAAAKEGLWIGPIHVCRENVQSVTRICDADGRWALMIALAPSMQPRFGEETARLAGRPMDIRLDGRLLSAPNINEPIFGLEAQISGPPKAVLKAAAKAAAKAAKKPC
ncbi:MAG TPA: hypothetical protein VHM92_08145 [Allosphingosinicella sp.]|nr:hypothetical protein [Allosphingosinicella sp.]